jgi:C1A family cysteine protease
MSNPQAASPSTAAVDLRPGLRAVGDQGRRGTCVAFATTAAHEHRRGTGHDGMPEDLSEETLYWGCKQLDGLPAPGTSMSAADLALQRWGQPAETLWPYDEARDDRAVSYQPPPEAIKAESCYRAPLRSITPGLASIRAELDAGRPIIVGMQVWEQFRRATTEPLPAPARSELFPGGHAVVVVGHDPQQAALLIRNSWGPRWGRGGHLWVADAVIPLLLGAWVVAGVPTGAAFTAAEDIIFTERTPGS